MLFSLEDYRKKNIALSHVFNMDRCVDIPKMDKLRLSWQENKGVCYTKALDVLMERTSSSYFSQIEAAQSQAIDYSRLIFPAYEFLVADVLYDDWMSIMDPHQERKRDHSVHQPLTAYIISEMLGRGVASDAFHIKDKSLLSLCAEKFLNSPKTEYLRSYLHDLHPSVDITTTVSAQMWAESLFYEAAIMAALFHDIGYPWQYIHTVCRGISMANGSVQAGCTFTQEGIFHQISNRLLAFPFYGYNPSAMLHSTIEWQQQVLADIESAFTNTHGFPGALAFQYLNDLIRKFPQNTQFSDAVFRFIQDWAAVAIMMHDMVWEYYGKDGYKRGKQPAKPQFRLHADVDPLSCLIAMADILEEFGRPMASFGHKDEDTITTDFVFSCESSEIISTGSILKINFKYKNNALQMKYKDKRQMEKERYFNDECGFVDLSPFGIDKVC